MNDISKTLELMLEAASTETPADHPNRLIIMNLLRYLHRQALCDVDRREPEYELLAAWRQLDQLLNTPGLQRFIYHKGHYITLARYYGDEPTTNYKKSLYQKPPSGVDQKPKNNNWDLTSFFKHLHSQIQCPSRHPHPATPEPDNFYLLMALRYLEMASQSSPKLRDPGFERQIWRYAYAKVSVLGLMEDFKHQTDLKSQLKAFLQARKA